MKNGLARRELPVFLQKHQPWEQHPESLLSKRLLVSHYRRSDWDDWLSATGLAEHRGSAERMRFSSSVLTWQAALDGLGIAMGQTALLASEIESKQLARPFNRPLRGEKGHYPVRPFVERESRNVGAFREWLLDEAA